MGQIWARIGRGCPPSIPRHIWVIFGKSLFFVKNHEKRPKSHETSMRRKTDFFWEIIQIKKTRIATTRNSAVRWPPHLPYEAHSWKNVFWQKTTILLVICVHAQDSCACTRTLCMHRILVHARGSCACMRACTRILGMHKHLFSGPWTFSWCWVFFGKTRLSSTISKNVWKIMKRPQAGKPFSSEKS